MVFEGDLSTADEAKLTEHPYAVVLGLPRNKIGAWLSGEAKRRAVIDVVLEQRSINGQRPSRRPLTELAYQAMRLSPQIDELAYQISLIRPLELLTDTPVDPKPDDPITLTCTIRFAAFYRTLF